MQSSRLITGKTCPPRTAKIGLFWTQLTNVVPSEPISTNVLIEQVRPATICT